MLLTRAVPHVSEKSEKIGALLMIQKVANLMQNLSFFYNENITLNYIRFATYFYKRQHALKIPLFHTLFLCSTDSVPLAMLVPH